MNNKPVAWMLTDRVVSSVPIEGAIPLYTHPAKPIDKPDECISGCPENQTCDYCAGIKTLTDEVIHKLWLECWDEIEFARAILRKANEK